MLVILIAASALAQTVDNPGFEGPPSLTVPSPTPPVVDGWVFGNEADLQGWADLMEVGTPVHCAIMVTETSNNGGTFVHAEGGGGFGDQQVVGAATYLTSGTPYRVDFEASLVRHYGQSGGYWQVSMAFDEHDADPIDAPLTTPAQAPWVAQSVGPFIATEATHELRFRAMSLRDGAGDSPGLDGSNPDCPYSVAPATTELLLDGVTLVPDTDADGLFDDEEPDCSEYDLDARLHRDVDEDGVDDLVEIVQGTDPCVPDVEVDETTEDTGDATTTGEPGLNRDAIEEELEKAWAGCGCASGASPGTALPGLALLLFGLAYRRRAFATELRHEGARQ